MPLPSDNDHSRAEPSIKTQVDALNAFLLAGHAQGRQAVLVIDEAQSLSAAVLEQLRLLTNLETSERKLLQIILIGQPELRDMLARPELEQLAQRVIARYHLEALSAEETPHYIRHRLAVAGPHAALPFDGAALTALHQLSGGVPRRINLLADRALLGAYGQGQQMATREMVVQAAQEVFGADGVAGKNHLTPQLTAPGWWQPRMVWALAGLMGLGLLALLVLLLWLGPAQRVGAPPLAAGKPALQPAAQGQKAQPQPSAGGATASRPPATAGSAWPEAQQASAGATAAQTPAAPLADLAQLLRSAPASPGTAWRELALRWNVSIGEGDPCLAVQQASLACFTSAAGGLPLVRQLARPGLVALRTPQSATVYALLVQLNDDSATLQVGSQRHVLPLAQLAQVWRGEFSTLWRTPPGWVPGRANLQDRALQQWIAQRLPDAAPAGTPGPATSGNSASAAALQEKLRVLQVAQGLPGDSASLPITLIQLNRRSGVAEPTLPATLER